MSGAKFAWRCMNWFTPTVMILTIFSFLLAYPANKKFDREELPKIDLRDGKAIAEAKPSGYGPKVDAIILREAKNPVSHYGNDWFPRIRAELQVTGAVTDAQITTMLNGPEFYPAQLTTTIGQHQEYMEQPWVLGYCLRWWAWPAFAIFLMWILVKYR